MNIPRAALDYCQRETLVAAECSAYVSGTLASSLVKVDSEALTVAAAAGVEAPVVFKTEAYGGFGGNVVDPIGKLNGSSRVRSATLYKRAGQTWPVGILLRMDDGQTFVTGRQEEAVGTLEFAGDEVLSQVEVGLDILTQHEVYSLAYLRLMTSKKRELAFGTQVVNRHVFTPPAGAQIVGFYGREGAWLDRIGTIYSYATSPSR